MKANRKFKMENDEAVSAVIGVILMVAITVAIAATVYVYVSGMIGDSPETTPNLQFTRDSTRRRITVASADPGNLNWENFEINIDGDGGVLNPGSNALNENTTTIGPDQLVKAGDTINLNSTSGDVSISIRHISTNTLVGTWEFN